MKTVLNLGALDSFLEKNRKQPVSQDNLNNAIHSLFAPDEKAVSKLQKGINLTGKDKNGFELLKEDNDIGEKTTLAFNRLKDEDEDGLKKIFTTALSL